MRRWAAEGRRRRVKRKLRQRCPKRGHSQDRRLVERVSKLAARGQRWKTEARADSRTKSARFCFGRSSIWCRVRRGAKPGVSLTLYQHCATAVRLHGEATWTQQTGAVRCVGGAGAADVKQEEGPRAASAAVSRRGCCVHVRQLAVVSSCWAVGGSFWPPQ
jgi:hypothetical protein